MILALPIILHFMSYYLWKIIFQYFEDNYLDVFKIFKMHEFFSISKYGDLFLNFGDHYFEQRTLLKFPNFFPDLLTTLTKWRRSRAARSLPFSWSATWPCGPSTRSKQTGRTRTPFRYCLTSLLDTPPILV